MSDYEAARLENIRKANEILLGLGLPSDVFTGAPPQQSSILIPQAQPKAKKAPTKKRARKDKDKVETMVEAQTEQQSLETPPTITTVNPTPQDQPMQDDPPGSPIVVVDDDDDAADGPLSKRRRLEDDVTVS